MIQISQEDVKKYIAEGESDRVEFKAKLASDASIAKVLSAFANTEGGVLLIGVASDSEIVGVPDDEVNQTIHRLSQIIDPMLPLPARIGAVDMEGKKVVYAVIDKVPVFYGPVYTSSGQVFVRQYSSSSAAASTDFYEPDVRERILTVRPKREVKAFVAMSFRIEEEPHLEDYYGAMERAVDQTGLPIRLVRVDLVEGDYEISQEIMNQIDEAEILIADFTLNSPNVYFELGYGRAGGKRVIQTARKGTALEFDIRNWRTHFYRNATELEKKLIPEVQLAYSDVVGK